jgi:uncharacterized protein
MSFIVNASEVPHSPWKNGGGLTQELLTWPAKGDWQLRISLATIEESGFFSNFEGVQRTFTIIEGQLTLTFDKAVYTLNHKDEALTFDGSKSCQCRLISVQAKALNIMSRSPYTTRVARLDTGGNIKLTDGLSLALFAIENSTVYLGKTETVLTMNAKSLFWVENASIDELNIQSGKVIACMVFKT